MCNALLCAVNFASCYYARGMSESARPIRPQASRARRGAVGDRSKPGEKQGSPAKQGRRLPAKQARAPGEAAPEAAKEQGVSPFNPAGPVRFVQDNWNRAA